ncbi:MAG TPA: hypothetical protein VII72_22740 [Myxococcota bacterium]|jgi:hypothetical protein
MPNFRSHALALLATAALTPGCFYYGEQSRDVDRTPIVDTGVGASILMPGESAPAFPGSPAAPGGPDSGPTGTAPGGRPISMIGGTRVDETTHARIHEEPVWLKYLTLPFAVVAAPFVAAKEAIQGEPEPGPEVPRVDPPRPQAAARATGQSYDEQLNDALERELDQRQSSTAAPRAGAAPAQPGASRGPSIADELASLQRAPAEASARPAPAPPAPESAPPAPRLASGSEPVADGIVDRNEDGRVDLWIYREKGEIVRRVLDEDYDGAPDSWVDYQEGEPVRRRADTNQDGAVDSWTFFRDGETSRHEQDTTGNGFRDRVGFYEAGKLVREEQDTLGSGRADVFVYYDDREQIVRREEDTDHDGRIDVISHYEKGRLSRRELLDTAAQAPSPVAPRATP